MKWQFLDLPFDTNTVSVGDTITLSATAAGCNQSGHWGYMYVDAFGSTNPGVVIPSPTSLNVNSGSSSGGTTVIISGSNFSGDSGVTGVSIGGVAAASFTVDSDTQITFVTPAHADGLVSVTVTNQNGSGSVPNSFTFSSLTPPTVFSNGNPSNGIYQVAYPGATFSANGIPTPTYSITGGSLPGGLSLLSTGALVGTPTTTGSYSFTVQATNSQGNTTSAFSILIDKASTATSITSVNRDTTRYGEAYTVNFHVSSTNSPATPDGTVSVSDGANPTCSGTLDGSGNGSCSLPSTFVTSPALTLTAAYAGNSNFYTSSGAAAHTVIKSDSNLDLASSNQDNAVYGEILTYTATAQAVAPGAGTPGGTVQFYVNSAAYGSPVSLNGSGTASLSLPYNYLLVGSYPVYAVYSGNTNFNGSTASTLTQVVKPAPTTLAVTSNKQSSIYGDSITISLAASANNPSLATPAGTVVLKIDGIQYGSSMTLNGSGTVSRVIPYLNLWPGTHAITAVYTPADPAQFITSSGSVTPAQVVNQAQPVFTFSSKVTSPVASQPEVFSVNVAHPSLPQSVIPTGTVQFMVDSNPVGSPVPLNEAGNASSIAISSLSAGSHSIIVKYSGDDYFTDVPTSTVYSMTVAQASTLTTIMDVEASTAVVGQPVPVNVRVKPDSPATAIPTGTVTVSNGTNSCSAPLAPDGTGSCNLVATQPGSPAITASYDPTTDFLTSASEATTGPTVSKDDSAVTITGFTPSSPVTGQSITVNFSVSAKTPGAGTPGGTVTISGGTGVSCQGNLSSGAGSCTLSFPSSGPTSLNASYTGDSNFNSASASTFTGPTVALAATSVSVESNHPSSVFGQPVHFTATLAVTTPGGGTPIGSIQFKTDGNNLGDPVALSGLSAVSPDISTLPVGSHTFTAVYLGDSNFAGATSSSPTQTVAKADTSLTLSSNQNPSPYGMSVTVTASVTANNPSIAVPADGKVQFIFDGVNYGSPVSIDANSKANKVLPYTALWVGSHSITATYAGSSSFNPSSASPLDQQVGLGHVSMTLDPSSNPILPGDSITFNATVTGNGSNNPKPSGTLQFVIGGANLGSSMTLDADGKVVSGPFSTPTPGLYSASLIYSGDDYYEATTLPFPDLFKVAAAASAFTNDAPVSGTFGLDYTFPFLTDGNPAPTISLASGALPDGLNLAADGVLSGTPTKVGVFSFKLHADNGTGHVDSGDYSITIKKIATSVSVSPSVEELVFGQPLQYTATVTSAAAAIPTGTVQFSVDGNQFGDPVTLSNGSASLTTSTLSVGAHSYSASYSGSDNQLAADTSLPDGTVSVAQNASMTSLSFSTSPVVYGQPFSLHAAIAEVDPSEVTPTGQVQFYADGQVFGAPVDLVDGAADSQDVPANLSGGYPLVGSAHTFSVTYLGNTNTLASDSSVGTQTVNQAPTSVSVTSPNGTVVYGTSVDMTISVKTADGNLAVPEGTVQLSIDGVKFGSTLTLTNGQAVRNVPYLNLWPGDHAVTAVYTPSGTPVQFLGSDNVSAPYHQIVTKANPLINLKASINDPTASQPFTYLVAVAHEINMPTQGTPSGTVQLFVDGNKSGRILTLDPQGKATSDPIQLSAGGHAITLDYSGDDYFSTALTFPDPPFSQPAAQKTTTNQIVSASPASAVVGQPVTLTAQTSVTGAPYEIPTGTLTISDGVHACTTAALAADGTASCQIAFPAPADPASLTATFAANGDYAGSVSSEFTGLTVSKANALVSVKNFSPASPVAGQPVTFNFTAAAVAPGAGNPTGAITLDAGNGTTCSADLSTGHCDLTFATAGLPSVSIAYAGDQNFEAVPASNVAVLPTIAKVDTSITVASSDSPSVYGQLVHFTAAVSASTPDVVTPSGTVQFYRDSAKLGDPVPLDPTGKVDSDEIDTLTAGDHNFSAIYSGDANFNPSTSAAGTQSVIVEATSITVTTDTNPSPYGQSVLATASVLPKDPGIIKPIYGEVTFWVDGVQYGAPVHVDADGKANKLLPYTALWVGTHSITVFYAETPDEPQAFSSSNNTADPYAQVVTQGNQAISVTPSVENPVFGQQFHFTATVLPSAPAPVPTGKIQFRLDDNPTPFTGDLALDASGSVVSLDSDLPVLSAGDHTITPIYSGDDFYLPSSAPATAFHIAQAGTSAAITSDLSSTTLVVGQPVTVSFSVKAAAPGSGDPTGLVTISNGKDSCHYTLVASDHGAGSCELKPSSSGSLPLTIAYAGDDNFGSDTPDTTVNGPTVSPATTGIAITTDFSDVNPVVGQPYSVTALASALDPSTIVPSGTVTITNGVNSCTAEVQPDGTATCQITPSSSGPQNLSAALGDNQDFDGSASAPVTGPGISAADTNVAFSLTDNPILPGAATHFNVVVSSLAPSSSVPSGSVQLVVDGQPSGSPVTLDHGSASLTFSDALTVGLHQVSAVFVANSDFNTASSAPANLNVVEGSGSGVVQPDQPTTITYTGTQDGQPVSVTVQVPSGAVSADTTLVFKKVDTTDRPKPTGQDFASLFTIDAYTDGVLQSGFNFAQPMVVTITYADDHWNEPSLGIVYWNGTEWSSEGIQVTGRDPAHRSITGSISHLSFFAISGEHQYITYFPILLQGASIK